MAVRQRGFTLTETVVAAAMATVAVVAFAYSFSNARGLVSRYTDARVALAAAQRRMEMLHVLAPGAPELALGSTHTDSVMVQGRGVALETWTVAPYDDPANGLHAGQADLAQVTLTLSWGHGTPAEQVRLVRFFPAR